MSSHAPRAASPRNQGNFELYAWFFMRISGLILLFIAVFHLLYMHLYTTVEEINYDWILARWANPAWRLFDWLLLVTAMTHGTNGLRTVIDDYVPRGLANVGAKWAIYVLALVMLLMGSQIIITAPKP